MYKHPQTQVQCQVVSRINGLVRFATTLKEWTFGLDVNESMSCTPVSVKAAVTFSSDDSCRRVQISR